MAKKLSKRPPARAKALSKMGTKINRSLALVMLRRGGGIDKAKILEKHFTIVLDGDTTPLNIPIKQIDTIIMNNLPMFPLDVIRLAGNEMSGKITGPDPVHIDSVQVGGKITKALADILSILF